MNPDPAKNILVYGGERIPYEVEIDQNRSGKIRINVFPDGSVNVDVPVNTCTKAIQNAVKKRARWITKNIHQAQERFEHVLPREYVSGETVFYLGRRYMLKIIPRVQPRGSVKLRGGTLYVQTQDTSPEAVRGKLRAWYRFRAREYFHGRMSSLMADLPWVQNLPSFELKVMKKRWGSCASSGNIVLNPFLVRAPRECVDYVLVHELCHLKEHNHSREFWMLMDRHVADWKRIKRNLDSMAEVILNE